MDEKEKHTNHGKTWPDGWTSQELADYMNREFERAGLKMRIRVRPDDEPLPTYPPGLSITDVLKARAGYKSPSVDRQEGSDKHSPNDGG